MTTVHDLKTAGLKATVPRLKIIGLFEASKVRHLTVREAAGAARRRSVLARRTPIQRIFAALGRYRQLVVSTPPPTFMAMQKGPAALEVGIGPARTLASITQS